MDDTSARSADDDVESRREMTALYLEALVEAFEYLRCWWTPGYRMGQDSKRILRPVASWLEFGKLDPYEYVRFCFDELSVTQDIVHPTMLKNPALMSRFVAEKPEREDDLRHQALVQASIISREVAAGRAVRDIATDADIGLNPLYRYILAEAFGLEELKETFREQAKRLLMFTPHYRAILGDSLPKELRDV
jgi:hypothetical protein